MMSFCTLYVAVAVRAMMGTRGNCALKILHRCNKKSIKIMYTCDKKSIKILKRCTKKSIKIMCRCNKKSIKIMYRETKKESKSAIQKDYAWIVIKIDKKVCIQANKNE